MEARLSDLRHQQDERSRWARKQKNDAGQEGSTPPTAGHDSPAVLTPAAVKLQRAQPASPEQERTSPGKKSSEPDSEPDTSAFLGPIANLQEALERLSRTQALQEEQLDALFQAAQEAVKGPRETPLTNMDKLKLYALYKQARRGKVQGQRPGMFDAVGRAKWDSWESLADMSQVDAKRNYCLLVDDLVPGWRAAHQKRCEEAVVERFSIATEAGEFQDVPEEASGGQAADAQQDDESQDVLGPLSPQDTVASKLQVTSDAEQVSSADVFLGHGSNRLRLDPQIQPISPQEELLTPLSVHSGQSAQSGQSGASLRSPRLSGLGMLNPYAAVMLKHS